MTDILRQFITASQRLFERNDYDKIYKDVPSRCRAELTEFLFNGPHINPLEYMSGTMPSYIFGKATIQGELVIPKNIKAMENNALSGVTAPSLVIDSPDIKMGSDVLSESYFNKISLADGIKSVPKGFCKYCSVTSQVYLPESVTRIKNDAFAECADSIRIITPYRDNPADRLIIPKGEIEWYRKHLRFTHAPKEVEDNAIQAE
jgi:hypothetical protein